MQAIISVTNLSKTYASGLRALKSINLDIRRGEIFALLGPNGAGKTTLVKMLVGLAHPDSGVGRIFGHPCGSLEAKSLQGFLPESFRFHDWMTSLEFLQFHGRLAGLSRDAASAQAPQLLERVGLAARSDSRLGTFSKGMLQRIGIAQAMMARPRLLFLDEPTSALDPLGRRDVRDIVRELRRQGVTVFLNSHLLSEIELVCDRVAIVNRGKVVAEGGLHELLAARSLTVRIGPCERSALEAVVEGFPFTSEGGRLVFDLQSEAQTPEVVRRLVAAGIDVYGVIPESGSLEDLFVRLVEEDEIAVPGGPSDG